MRIETTVNIDMDVFHDISRAALITGHPARDIISSLLRRVSDDHDAMVRSWKRVRYQKRNRGVVWKCFHLELWPDEYEFFLDLRKVFKMSVSFLVAYAVEKYLDEVIFCLIKTPDNNRYKNYTIVRRIVEGLVCWIYYWGIPHTLPGNT